MTSYIFLIRKKCDLHINKYLKNIQSNFIKIKLMVRFFNKSDQIVSFDVYSLFTNVPLTETIDIIADYLYSDNSKRVPPFKKYIFPPKKSILFIYFEKFFRGSIDLNEIRSKKAPLF